MVDDEGKVTEQGIVDYVDFKSLSIDDQYQRPLNSKLMQHLAKHFNWKLFGIPTVGRRRIGGLYIIDGHHRVEALHRRGFMGELLCLIVDTTPEEEAEIFWQVQEYRRSIQPLERFKAKLFAHDCSAVEIQNVCLSLGITIPQQYKGKSRPAKYCEAVVALEEVHDGKNGNETLYLILEALISIWPDAPDALSGIAIRGMRLFFRRWPDAELKILIAKCSMLDPSVITQKAVDVARLLGHSAAGSWADALQKEYNRGLRTHRLEGYHQNKEGSGEAGSGE